MIPFEVNENLIWVDQTLFSASSTWIWNFFLSHELQSGNSIRTSVCDSPENCFETECEIDKGRKESESANLLLSTFPSFSILHAFPSFLFALCAPSVTAVCFAAHCWRRCTFSTKINVLQFFAGAQWDYSRCEICPAGNNKKIIQFFDQTKCTNKGFAVQ